MNECLSEQEREREGGREGGRERRQFDFRSFLGALQCSGKESLSFGDLKKGYASGKLG